MSRGSHPCWAVLYLALAAGGCERPPEEIPFDVAQHRAEIENFRDARIAELEAPDSWLALMALHWLSEGKATMGSDPSNDLVLPAGKAAAFVGSVTLEGEVVRFVAANGVRVTMGVDSTLNLRAGSGAFPPDIRGDPVMTEAELGSEGTSKYTVLRHGDISWIRIRRGSQFALRVRDNTSDVYDRFHGIDRYDTDPAMRLTATWVPQDKVVSVPNVLGTVSEVPSPAYLAFWIDGERHRLDVTGEPGSEQFMMVFADETSGQTTYGGGRYLWIRAPDEQGRVVLDFNRAYNPPCVWTPFATCPLPTRNNRLSVTIEAGEMDWAH
jgi:uncharacterized protein (DUF1684 family)